MKPSQDNGELNLCFGVNITNIDDVINTGAKPLVARLGPIGYRKYRESEDVQVDAGKVTWYDRTSRVFDPALTDALYTDPTSPIWDSYVTIPNLAYRGLEGTLKRTAQSSGVTMQSFEDIAVPLFASQAFSNFNSTDLDVAIRILVGAVALHLQLAEETVAAGGQSLAIDEWARADTSRSSYFRLPAAPSSPILPGVQDDLWDSTKTISLLHPTGYSLAARAAMEQAQGVNGGAAMTAYVTAWTAQLSDATNGDPDYLTNLNKLNNHIGLVLTFVGRLFSSSNDVGHAAERLVLKEMFTRNLIVNQQWWEMVPAQLGSNAVTGMISSFFLQLPVENAVAGPTILNGCPSGTSLKEIEVTMASMPVAPEFSCWASRTPASFRSKIPSDAMFKVLRNTTTGPGIAPPLLTGGIFAGTRNSGRFLAAANALMKELEAPTSAPMTAIKQGLQDVRDKIAAFDAAYVASGGLVDASVTQAIADYETAVSATDCLMIDTMQTGLACSQLLDLAAYMNYIAREFVWEPTFVKRGPVVWSASRNSFVDHPDAYYAALRTREEADGTAMRAGPFIRCTLREYFELGCHDNFLNYVSQRLYFSPAGAPSARLPYVAPSMYTDAQWADKKSDEDPDTRYTGSTDKDLVDLVYADKGETFIRTWNGPAGSADNFSPVEGSYSGVQFKPHATMWVDYDRPYPELRIWVWQGRRAVALKFEKEVKDPSGNVRLWRYRLALGGAAADWSAAIPRMKTDEDGTTPACAANVGALSSYAQVYLTKPFFAGCDPSDRVDPADQYDFVDPTLDLSEDEFGTFVDVEPITGLAMNAQKQLGPHLRWTASPWYPSLRETYGLVYYLKQYGSVKEEEASDFQRRLEDVRFAVRTAVPAALFVVGILLLLSGLGCMACARGCCTCCQRGGKGVVSSKGPETQPAVIIVPYTSNPAGPVVAPTIEPAPALETVRAPEAVQETERQSAPPTAVNVA